MKLVIVESPNKCATISSFLGDGYKVIASKGNIRDLATNGKDGLGVDVANNFKPTYAIDRKKSDTVKMLKKEAKSADEIFLATDPDREGEAISWHLSQVLGLDVATTKRLLFHEITMQAISESIANPTTIDMKLVDSQETRRIYDRVIGFKLSKLLQNKIKCKSAGRVQSATLKILVDNDKERKVFVPEEYWAVTIKINVDGTVIEANLSKVNGESFKFNNEDECKDALSKLGNTVTLKSLKTETKHIESKAPLTTSTLAQEAFTKFGFPTALTTSLAQKLYEGLTINGKHVGLITYIRTDSTRISPVFYNDQAKPYIIEKFGNDYLGRLRADKKQANAQDAHEAIRPTDISFTPEDAEKFLNANEAKLYKLIYQKAVGSLMKAKVVETTTATFESNGLEFTASGSKTVFKGYSILNNIDNEDEAKMLPVLEENKAYDLVETIPAQKFTQPPAAITEARLVKLMEKEGIGRPSTYASTIKTLLQRGYVTSEKGVLTPTDSGYRSIDFLEQNFSEIVSTNYTAGMESKLDEIQDGNVQKLDALKDFYFPFVEKFDVVMKNAPKQVKVKIVEGKFCPVCGAPLAQRKSKYGSFLSCSNFPTCSYIEKKQKTEAKATGEMCPVCGKPLVERVSKGKTFVACSGFPKCHYIKGNDEKKETVTYTEADYIKVCPKCGTGHIVIKHSKRGEFYACTNYPKCTYHEYPKKTKSEK